MVRTLLENMDRSEHAPLAIINDGLIQHMRVGACAGLGAKYLSRQDSCDIGIFGSGGMARSYLEAFYEVRKLRRVLALDKQTVDDVLG